MRGKGNEAVFTLSVIPRKMWGIDLIFTNFYILSKEDYTMSMVNFSLIWKA